MGNYKYYDRDLSWLSFNYRVLQQAQNPKVPLLERLRFAAIYSSNLDEFFRVRVANIRSLKRINKQNINKKLDFDPDQLLNSIHKKVSSQLNEYGKTLKDITTSLTKKDINIVHNPKSFSSEAKTQISKYFKSRILGYLQPYVFSKSVDDAFLNNQQLYLAVSLKKGNKVRYGYVNIPSNKLPRFFKVREDGKSQFIFLDDIVRDHMDIIFPDYKVLECQSIKLNKDADLQIDDEYSGDLVEKIEKQIKKRNLGVPSRFLYDSSTSDELLNVLITNLHLDKDDLVAGGRYHNLNDFWQIPNGDVKKLEYDKLTPVRNRIIDNHRTLFHAMAEKDILLHFPYQSYDYVLQFFNEAAIDPEVRDIYVTFYRMAKGSVIGDALISASRNGKKVVVFMELKARFDEENNLIWAAKMKEAGIKIVYSIPGLKVHAKVALVRKKTDDDNSKYYGFFGTGNLNENTAKIYCDYGLLTTDQEMCEELHSVFRFLHKRKKPGSLKKLIVSQFNAIESFSSQIDKTIKAAISGEKSKIIIKVNNLEERTMINKLYEAGEAGVDVTIIARSICCLIPDTNGIKVLRLVDRFLEHARIFYFEYKNKEELFLGSSDWMNRNLHSRVEVSFPVKSKSLKNELKQILAFQISDNTNLVRLDKNLKNNPVKTGKKEINAQSSTYQMIKLQNKDQ